MSALSRIIVGIIQN